MQTIKSGNKVAVIAPCGQIGDMSKIDSAVKYLKSLGLKPVFGKHLLKVRRYMAGTDIERAADINSAFANPEIKAVFCVRAAAGGTRVLPYIDYELARANPKPVIGFCDNAAIQIALHQKSKLVSYNGFVMTYDFKNGNLDNLIKDNLEKLLNGELFEIKSGKTLQKGSAEGTLICSNLTVLTRMAGTPYFPDLKNKILLLEEVNEPVYKIDLMLQQLKQQKNFDKLKGLVFGQFTGVKADEEDGTIKDCLRDFLQGTNLPAIYDFNFGHTPSRHVLPLGAKVSINADKNTLTILKY